MKRIRTIAPAAAVVIALPLGLVVAKAGDAADVQSPGVAISLPSLLVKPSAPAASEVAALKTLLPPVRDWQNALNRRDRAAARQAGEDFEIVWQGVEVWVNHRSVVLYQDLEPDSQFIIDAELEKAQPNWGLAKERAQHLLDDVNVAIALSGGGPTLPTVFDDLAKLRRARAYVNVVNQALADAVNDRAKALSRFDEFLSRWPEVRGFIGTRSPSALAEIDAALLVAQTSLNNAGLPLLTVRTDVAAFANRLGYGVNLLNAAARGWDRLETAPTAPDLATLDLLLTIKNAANGAADSAAAMVAGATGPGSTFATVEPALEAKARFINTAPGLRNALRAFAASTPANLAPTKKAALEQVAIAQQAVIGQFWGNPALSGHL